MQILRDLRDPETLRPLIASTARFMIPLIFGLFHKELTPAEVNEAVTWAVGGVLWIVSLFWSNAENKKLLKTKTPERLQSGPATDKTFRSLLPALILIPALAAMIPGCTAPKAAQPVAQSNLTGIDLIAQRHQAALILLAKSTDSTLRIRRVTTAGDAHRSLILAGYLGGPSATIANLDALMEDLTTDTTGNALIDTVNSGSLTPEQATAWLSAYASARATGNRDMADDLLAALDPVAAFDEIADAIRESIAQAATFDAILIGQVQQDARSLADFTALDFTSIELAATAEEYLIGKVDPQIRDDALLLFKAIIGADE